MVAGDPAASRRQLVLNADDFGSTDAANAAVVRAHREGVLTSASVMVGEPAFPAAVRLAGDCPGLGVGLHVAVTDARPTLPASDVPHLVDLDGRFAPSPASAGPRWYFQRACREEIQREVAAQFARLVSAGVSPDHVDGHQHAHLHPIVWREVVRGCVARGVRWVRVPWEEPRSRGGPLRAVRLGEWVFLRAMALWCRRDARRNGLRYAGSVYGHLRTGDMRVEYVARLLGELRGGVVEIYFHPGTAHAGWLPGGPAGMDTDLDALLGARVRERIAELGLRPCAFGDLPA